MLASGPFLYSRPEQTSDAIKELYVGRGLHMGAPEQCPACGGGQPLAQHTAVEQYSLGHCQEGRISIKIWPYRG